MPANDPWFPNYAIPYIELESEAPIGTFLSKIRWRSAETPLKGMVYEFWDGSFWSTIWLLDFSDPDAALWYALISARLIPSGDAAFDLGIIDQRWLKVFANVVYTAVSTQTANYTMTENDSVILVDAASGAKTITLPVASNLGQQVHIKKTDSSANAVTIQRAGTDTIQGATSVSLTTQYASRTLIANGTNMWIIMATT